MAFALFNGIGRLAFGALSDQTHGKIRVMPKAFYFVVLICMYIVGFATWHVVTIDTSYFVVIAMTGFIGLCYGGPYAILGPARLGCSVGIAFHGTKVQNYLDELDGITAPIVLHWGDQDHALPPEALAQIRAATSSRANTDITIYPGVQHGYTSVANPPSYDAAATRISLARAVEVINELRDADTLAAAS